MPKGTLALLVIAAALAPAGCGSDEGAKRSGAAAVEEAVRGFGTTQEISCERVGVASVDGSERDVFRCMFEEEESQSGEMRIASRCYVVEAGGSLRDVTRELADRGLCSVTSR